MEKALRSIHILNLILFWLTGFHMALDLVTVFFFSALVFPSFIYFPVAAALAGVELILRSRTVASQTDRNIGIVGGVILELAAVFSVIYIIFSLLTFSNTAFNTAEVLTLLQAIANKLVVLFAAAVIFCLARYLVKGAVGMGRVSVIGHLLLLAGMLVILISRWDPYANLAGSLFIFGIPRFYRALSYYIPLAGILNICLWLAGQVRETLKLIKSQS